MARTPLVLSLAALLSCNSGPAAPITEVDGTWGGENAGLIATDSVAHIHIGCTLGYTKGRISVGADGTFEISGTYNVDAFPIDRGIIHPARFSGRVTGTTMNLTVVLTDDERQLGPVTLVLGKEPVMGPCPICRRADWDAAVRQRALLIKSRHGGTEVTKVHGERLGELQTSSDSGLVLPKIISP